MIVKIEKHIGVYVYPRFYLIWSPVLVDIVSHPGQIIDRSSTDHVAGWDPCNLHMIYSSTCFLGCICTCTDPVQPLTTGDEELDDLQVDHDLICPICATFYRVAPGMSRPLRKTCRAEYTESRGCIAVDGDLCSIFEVPRNKGHLWTVSPRA